ncbi:prevent-host-death protein [Klugiella xanthotipulae]|uniref:Prevent-host-death family protein n=1 Tax=Klugiella xanthotipulae TaxID=244735 RepID=A0A543I6B9_9MICO|nr:prevent-host-death protein [Klugiella xanthotipulae]TQM66109.1 hypothetical protein FB466_0936 [Klugiella xanthotipulae]
MQATTPDHLVVKSSDLSRDSKHVFREAEKAPVEVTRRDGEPLMLTTKAERDTHKAILNIAAQLIAVALDEDRGPLEDRLAVHYPWIKLLNADDQKQCAKDIIDTARAAFVVDQPFLIVTEIKSWRDTAEAVGAGWNSLPVTSLDEPVTVPAPLG